MILSDKTIRELIRKKELIIEGMNDQSVQPASVDLRLSNKFKVVNAHMMSVVDLDNNTPQIIRPWNHNRENNPPSEYKCFCRGKKLYRENRVVHTKRRLDRPRVFRKDNIADVQLKPLAYKDKEGAQGMPDSILHDGPGSGECLFRQISG